MENVKWLTVATIAVLVTATYLDWYWVWGVLFIYWAAIGIRDGDVFVVEPVSRDENLVLFWLIAAMWAGLGVWAVVWDLAWRFGLDGGAWYGG